MKFLCLDCHRVIGCLKEDLMHWCALAIFNGCDRICPVKEKLFLRCARCASMKGADNAASVSAN